MQIIMEIKCMNLVSKPRLSYLGFGVNQRYWLQTIEMSFPSPNGHFMCSEYDFSGPSGMVSQTHSLNFAEDWQSDKGKKTEKKGTSEKQWEQDVEE